MATTDVGMKYRFLGDSGLLVSTFGFGCMVQNDSEVDKAYDILVHAFKHGINFWDTAEVYGQGGSERVIGKALERGTKEGVWTRQDIVLTTKVFFGTKPGPNNTGLSRKHIVEGTKASLQRLNVDYVDVLFCHRPEKSTPIEEVVRAMNFVINQGWALYWGTSEWHESDILEARAVADRLGLIRPLAEQPQYNLVNRSRVEVELQSLYKTHRLGLTTWSPLAFGLLTGKYGAGIPEGTRISNAFYANRFEDLEASIEQTEQLRPIAQELGCSVAQLALAWTASNENVSTVLLGAKNIEQLDENLKAFEFVSKMTPEVKQRIEAVFPLVYKPSVRDQFYTIREKQYVE